MKSFLNKKIDIKKVIINLLEIIIGTFIMAISTSLFLLPNKLSTGGFSGLATIIYYFFNLPLGTGILILNIPLLIIAFFKLGKDFFIKTIIGTFSLSYFINILENLEPFTNDRLLAAIYGGLIMGIGTGLVLKANSSTGGSDLLSVIIKTYKNHFQTSNLIVIIDIVIILISLILFKSIEIGLYSAIAIFLMGKMIDIIFEGVGFTKIMFIISPQYEKIAKIVGTDVNRGSTGIYARGMYKNEEKMMLLCVGSRNEVGKIKDIALQIDDKAFIIISNARETWGKGFKT